MNVVKLTYDTYKGGFDTILMMRGTIRNPSPYVIRDPRITCKMVAPSGTSFGDATATLYERIDPGQTIKVRDLNFGFVHSQAYGVGCTITDLTATEAPAPHPNATPVKPMKTKRAKPAD